MTLSASLIDSEQGEISRELGTSLPLINNKLEAVPVPVIQNITNANYTLLATDDAVYFTCGLTSRTCTLPDPTTVPPGKPFDIYKIDGGVGLLTAIGTVDGGSNPIVALTLLRGHLRITSNGTVWCSG